MSTKKDYLTFIQFFYFSNGNGPKHLFYNQKRKDLVKNQWFVIGIITISVIVISNVVIAALVRVDNFGIREIYQTKEGVSTRMVF